MFFLPYWFLTTTTTTPYSICHIVLLSTFLVIYQPQTYMYVSLHAHMGKSYTNLTVTDFWGWSDASHRDSESCSVQIIRPRWTANFKLAILLSFHNLKVYLVLLVIIALTPWSQMAFLAKPGGKKGQWMNWPFQRHLLIAFHPCQTELQNPVTSNIIT